MANQLICCILLLFAAASACYAAETSTCLTVYKEGGAPAVFRSPRCPKWALYHEEDHGRGRRYGPASNCQLAMHQGRRRSQEDRAVCAFGIRIPFIGINFLTEEINVDVVAVFDGHNGAEASEMSSRLFLDYFYLHVYFLLNRAYSSVFKESAQNKGESEVILHGVSLDEWPGWDTRFEWTDQGSLDRKSLFEILRESLLRAIHDIDAIFTKEAARKSIESGSTAIIVLIVEGQVLVANVGDSKAILCSETLYYQDERKGRRSNFRRRRKNNCDNLSCKDIERRGLMKHAGLQLCAKELTKDHHPDRDGERKRVEDAGGFVEDWSGVARVNGQLAVSRAIGDVPYKRYGVISTPEVTGWMHLHANDTFLVVGSDGIFEKLTVQEVCDLLRDASLEDSEINDRKYDLADLLVKTAIDRGSMDNMAAVVIPLAPYLYSSARNEDKCTTKGFSDSDLLSDGKYLKWDNNEGRLSTSLISMDFFHQIERKFQKLLVKADYRKSCFYLAEELKESSDLVFISPKAGKTHEHNDIVPYLLEGQTSDASMWPLNIYDEKGTCLDIDLGSDNAEGHCVSRESLVNFFGLLNSIPFNDWGSHLSDSFNQKNSDFRYTLKRKFDRGSYGEVWLAYHWNCSEETLGANLHPNIYNASSPLHSHVDKSGADPESSEKSNYDYFILKRIMVERGNAAYLSGLREKYYGEIFANASKLMKQSEESASGTASYTVRQSVVGPYIYGTESMIYEEGLNHIARFVESFISESKETWLVFRHEGISLSKLLYTVDEREVLQSDDGDRMSSNVQVLHPSAWWNWLRTTEAGKGEIRNIMRQLLLAIKSCHRRGITHRDIKPENMIVCFEDINSGKCERVTPTRQNSHPARVRIIDFGSAVDEFTLKNLYGSGPSRLEQTYEYTPPEALLNATWFKAETRTTMKYDIWSAGVVFLELILGSPHVFQISDRTRAMLDQHLEGWGDSMKELAYKLRSLMEMCILIPGLPSQQHHDERRRQEGVSWPASWKCTEESFASLVKNRDPLKLGFPNIWALRLVRQLLAWHPEERISIDEALQHPYFESDL